jgi:hypothetical protein
MVTVIPHNLQRFYFSSWSYGMILSCLEKNWPQWFFIICLGCGTLSADQAERVCRVWRRDGHSDSSSSAKVVLFQLILRNNSVVFGEELATVILHHLKRLYSFSWSGGTILSCLEKRWLDRTRSELSANVQILHRTRLGQDWTWNNIKSILSVKCLTLVPVIKLQIADRHNLNRRYFWALNLTMHRTGILATNTWISET